MRYDDKTSVAHFEIGEAEKRIARVQALVDRSKAAGFDTHIGDEILSLMTTAFGHLVQARRLVDESRKVIHLDESRKASHERISFSNDIDDDGSTTSARAAEWAATVQAGDPGAKLVLLTLAEWGTPGATQRVDLGKLAWRAEMTCLAIAAALFRLKDRGLLATLELDEDGCAFAYALPDSTAMDAAIAALS